ncbi:(Fe-S)-binding protein [Geodermatophilus sp. TF02-6]|uniref:(Fe-S)-binding protein n=1 Tax=Geodermatophilus sp. TF02-6 TaxID=2250575 RepID=UPI000DEA704D|nr:(Fe-S)-binding protein [Geodermatophilus sp. TF02-6]RBY77634.1 (Fe-S)-binding protein [Geodermatophilus sp. TF02-6]
MSAEVSGATDAPGAAGAASRGIFPAELLDRCISCGFCLPACPTYALSKDEKSSPRGRITLMRALETGVLDDDDPTLREESSFCLGCRACEPVCPAGVQYGELLEHWRSSQWQGRRRPPLARVLTNVVVRNWLVRRLGTFRGHARTATVAPQGPHLMLGCFERALFPGVSRAARRLRPELDCPADQGCCGALHAHNGDLELGREMARRLGEQLPGTIVTTAGGCAAHLTGVLGRDRVEEFSEYLVGRSASDGSLSVGELRVDGRRARVALQDSCHLRNGMDVWRQPRELIAAVADHVELPGAARCCGSAGTYSLLRPKDSRRVLAPKLDQIEAAGVDYVVVVNPGCQRQLVGGLRRRRSRVRVLHLTELLAAAQDGGLPRRRLRLPARPRRAQVPADEPAGLAAHLNDRPLPDDPGASGAGRPDAL